MPPSLKRVTYGMQPCMVYGAHFTVSLSLSIGEKMVMGFERGWGVSAYPQAIHCFCSCFYFKVKKGSACGLVRILAPPSRIRNLRT